MDRITVRDWIKNFKAGEYSADTVATQIKAGWWDWFCRDSSLARKTKTMGSIVKQVKDGGKVDLDNFYVWFKNNCPLNGPLYDDFRFANLEDGEVQLTIQINCCWNQKRYAVFGRKEIGGEFSQDPLFESDSSRELVKWLNTPWEDSDD